MNVCKYMCGLKNQIEKLYNHCVEIMHETDAVSQNTIKSIYQFFN